MKLKSKQQLWVTPFPELPVFERILYPSKRSINWEREITASDSNSVNTDELSPRLREIQAKSQEIQAQLQQLTQRYSL